MFRRYPTGAIAVHDLGHLDALSDDPGLTLFVSPRTLYLLQNLAGADVALSSRYALDLLYAGYIPVADTDPEYLLYESVVRELQVEVIPLPTWETWTGTLYQPAATPLDATFSPDPGFLVDPRGLCHWHMACVVGEVGSAGAIFLLGPGPAFVGPPIVGDFVILRDGVGFVEGSVYDLGDGRVAMLANGAVDFVGSSPSFALAVGDYIWMQGTYRTEVS